jgi:hypothetical protein
MLLCKKAVDGLYKTRSNFRPWLQIQRSTTCIYWSLSYWHGSCFYLVVPTQGRVSAQTDRKRCEVAKGSVKFGTLEKNKKIEEQENNIG